MADLMATIKSLTDEALKSGKDHVRNKDVEIKIVRG
jgi:hypothetical protein